MALVTLTCPVLAVQGSGAATDKPPLFDAARLAEYCAALDLPHGLWPVLRHDMPLGAGAGASTATLVALALALGHEGLPEDLARACLAVEGASDPLMLPYPDRVLWASREARVLRALPPPPACDVVGGFWGAPVRTDPTDKHFAPIDDLVTAWAEATDRGDLPRCAALASESSRRCTTLRGPEDPMADLARELGALGHVRAHTGSARGLVFAPGTVPPYARDALSGAGLTGVLHFTTGGQA